MLLFECGKKHERNQKERMIQMKKKINWKHATIVLLTASNLTLIGIAKDIKQDTIDDLYFNQIESGHYDEGSTEATRNPMTGKLEDLLIDNHKHGRY